MIEDKIALITKCNLMLVTNSVLVKFGLLFHKLYNSNVDWTSHTLTAIEFDLFHPIVRLVHRTKSKF